MKLEKFKEKNSKKKGIIIFTICCVLLIAGVFFSSSFALFEMNEVFNLVSGNVKDLQDISFTYYVDHQIVKEAPEKGSGKLFDEVSSVCTNDANVRWNYEDWGPVVTDWNRTKTKCSIYFNTAYSEDILNGAFPVLKEELTPITIKSDGLVKKADTTSKWYSYEEKNWANAVITRSSYDGLSKNGKVNGATKQDGYVSFDGVDDYIDLGYENYDFGKTISYGVTFRPHKIDGRKRIIGNWEQAGIGISIKDGIICADIYGTGYQWVEYTGETIKNNEIYTVMSTYDGSTLKLYINGELLVSKEIAVSIKPSTMPIFLGANPNSNSIDGFADMDLYEAVLFSRVLSEEEIKENYASDIKVKNEEGLLKYVNFAKDMYEANEVIPEESIESYFVWIPRYRYKIFNEGNYNRLTANVVENQIENKAQIIEIEFENKDVIPSTGVSVGEWLTHPAFVSFRSNGMWVGKFETSKGNDKEENSINPSGVEIKPNVTSWRNIQVANAFYTTYNYKRNLESHMMKNTEWGSVAYLQHSNYGSHTSVRVNNHSDYKTGYASKVEPTCGYTTTNLDCNHYCNDGSCNEPYNTEVGYLASTTGNITGIYDMSGGSWEYVMGVLQDSSGNLSAGRNDNYHSGFVGVLTYPQDGKDSTKTSWTLEDGGVSWPDSRYYDMYPYSTIDKFYNRSKFGDAIKEMGPFGTLTYDSITGTNIGSGNKRNPSISSWYLNFAHFIRHAFPFVARGGTYFHGSDCGMFAFTAEYGSATETLTFRIVLTL